jgi:hypothetical protein
VDRSFTSILALAEMRQPGDSGSTPLPFPHLEGHYEFKLVEGADGQTAIDWHELESWELSRRKSSYKALRRSPRGALDRFLRLETAPDQKVLAFARDFGPLTFTEERHLHPYQILLHERPIDPGSFERGLKRPTPVSWYRNAAESARAILSLAASAYRGGGGRDEDWELIGFPRDLKRRTPEDLWSAVRAVVDDLLLRAGVRPTLLGDPMDPSPRSSKGEPQIFLTGHGLWGVLAAQLAFAVVRADRLASCSQCGKSFTPKRRARTDRKIYCMDCGERSGWRFSNAESQRKRRARKRPNR